MDTPIIALTGKDTIAIDGLPFLNFGTGDVFMGEFPNNISTVDVGKNGNVIAALNANGALMEATIRLLRGSPEDIYLTTREAQWQSDPAAFVVYTGNFVKRIGDGTGAISPDTYIAAFGIPKKLVAFKSNVAGDTTQALAEHYITFGQSIRAIF